MNREIKFRVWDNEEMIYNPSWGFVGCVSLNDGLQLMGIAGGSLMQYTGLKDKNGEEIYEGDIVRILYTDWPSQPAEKNGRYKLSLEDYKKSISYIGEVIYKAPEYTIDFHSKYNTYGSIIPGTYGEIEVIGNIYENKELTK